MKEKKFRLPNAIITMELDYSAKRVAAVLYRHKTSRNTYRKSVTALAHMSKLSVPTVRKAVEQLEKAGVICCKPSLVYNYDLKRMVYGQTEYLCLLSTEQDYTLIPRRLLSQDFKSATFTVALYIFQQMGNEERAYPSIAMISKKLSMGRATVCRALTVLKRSCIIVVQACLKRNNAFTSHSYFTLRSVQEQMHSAVTFVVSQKQNKSGVFNCGAFTSHSCFALKSVQEQMQSAATFVMSKKGGKFSIFDCRMFLHHQFNRLKNAMQDFFSKSVVSFFSN